MDSGFVTVFDLSQAGYRDIYQVIAVAIISAGCAAAIFFWAKENKSERAFIIVLWSVFAIIFLAAVFIQFGAYREYLQLKDGLRIRAEVYSGHIILLRPKEQFDRFAINDREFRYSSEHMPYRLGFQKDDFFLQPTFLVRVTTVDEVIVKMQVHNAHLM